MYWALQKTTIKQINTQSVRIPIEHYGIVYKFLLLWKLCFCGKKQKISSIFFKFTYGWISFSILTQLSGELLYCSTLMWLIGVQVCQVKQTIHYQIKYKFYIYLHVLQLLLYTAVTIHLFSNKRQTCDKSCFNLILHNVSCSFELNEAASMVFLIIVSYWVHKDIIQGTQGHHTRYTKTSIISCGANRDFIAACLQVQ